MIELRTDEETRRAFSRDWSEAKASMDPQDLPEGVYFPKSTDEVSAILRDAYQKRIPIVPSGGRTGLSGGACARRGEYVLSLTKMNRILSVNEVALTAEVEAGVVTEALHQEVEGRGLLWPIDFASKGSSTIGGNIATNAGGVHVLKYGSTRSWVLGLKVVTARGEILELNGALEKNNTGLDFRSIFVGSEGILGVITEATLRLTASSPKDERRVALIRLQDFKTVVSAFGGAREIFGSRLRAFECWDHACGVRVLDHQGKRGIAPRFSAGTPGNWTVLLESEEIEVGRWLADLGKWVEECGEGVLDTRIFETKSMGAQAWSLREEVPESILSGGEVHQQDISVALARLTSLEEALREVFRPLGETTCQAFLFGHIGDGNLHVFLERKESVSTEAFRAECSRLDQTLFRIVSSLQGSVSAEHGLGLLKLEAYERFSGSPSHELELRLKRDLKRLFDPTGILNPGKVVSL